MFLSAVSGLAEGVSGDSASDSGDAVSSFEGEAAGSPLAGVGSSLPAPESFFSFFGGGLSSGCWEGFPRTLMNG